MKRLLLSLAVLAVFSAAVQAQYDSNQVRRVGSLPATCTLGTTNPVTYGGVVYHCTATNTWTKSNPGQLPTSTYAGLPTCAAGNDGQLYRVTDANRDVYSCYGSAAKWVSRNGGVYNIRDFGAVGNGSTSDRVAIQAAIDAAAVTGSRVKVPEGNFVITAHASGYGLLLKDKVTIEGDSDFGSRLSFSGAFTDSMIRGYSRDDNNPSNFETCQVRNLYLTSSGANTGIAVLDLTGLRGSAIENIQLEAGAISDGTVALRLADQNPAATSHKSTFFNILSNIHASNHDTFLRVLSVYGDCSVNQLMVGNSYSKYGMDFNGSGFPQYLVVESFYFAGGGAGSQALKSDLFPRSSTFNNCGVEGFVVANTYSVTGSAYSTSSATYNGLTVPPLAIYSFEGYAPIVARDFDYQFVASGLVPSLTGDGRVRAGAGIGYNIYRYNHTAFDDYIPTNTGSPHTEYLVLTQLAVQDYTRIVLKTSTSAADVVLGSFSIDATGNATALLADLRPLYPSLQLRRISLVNTAVTATVGALALDCSNTNIQTVTFGAGDISSLTATSLPVGPLWISFTQDSTGSRVVTTWNSLFKFAGGTKPTLTTTANATDQFQFICNGSTCTLMTAIYDVK